MATRSEVHFPPPPRPSEPWKEFMARLDKYASDSQKVTPAAFLKQVGGTPHHPLLPLKSLRGMLGSRKHEFLPNSLFLGVITRKFHVRFCERRTASGCFFSVWVKDSTDLVRITFWDSAVHMYYDKFQEGMLVTVRGFKLKPLYRHEKELSVEADKLSPVEVIICELCCLPSNRSIKVSHILCIDTHDLWNYKVSPDDPNIRPFLTSFLDFDFCPTKLKMLADSPISLDYRRSLTGRIVFKSSIRTAKSSMGEVPCVWLAICDGSLDGTERGSGRKEYVWLFLMFNFQPRLLQQLEDNQLIVVTQVAALYLFRDDWNDILEWRLVCHSTASTQVHIVPEEPDTRVWHYFRSVQQQKHQLVRSHISAMSRSFGEVPPEVTHTSATETLFQQGRYRCEYQHSYL